VSGLGLAIGMPIMNGMMCAQTAQGVSGALMSGAAATWITCCNESFIARARNTIAATFLDKTEFPWLLWIDADMVFDPGQVAALVGRAEKHGWPILGGIYSRKKIEGGEVWAGLGPEDEDGCHRVAVTGTGFLLVARRVFESVEGLKRIRGKYWDFHPCGPVDLGGGEWDYDTEDWGFCRDALRRGFPVRVDPSIRLGHLGMHEFRA